MALKNVVTPRGVAQYPWLTKPDTKFDADGVYKISLEMDTASKECQDLCEKIREAFVEEFGQKKLAKAHLPFTDDEETGKTSFSFKSKMKPKLYNSKGQPIKNGEELKIGGGSICKVSFSGQPYDKGINTGVVLYLNGVQIIELVSFASGDGFGDEGDSFAPEDEGTGFSNESGAEDDGNGDF